MIQLLNNTPIEKYNLGGLPIYVKREDLSASYPMPSFSKVRGLLEVITRLKKEGFTILGYTETSVSMAGIGVCAICKELGLQAVIFDPQYKVTQPLHTYHREQWNKFNATIIPLKAGMAKVNFYISKNILESDFKHSFLLPLGLPFVETINAAREECVYTRLNSDIEFNTIVVPVGSGTVCAGVIKGFLDKTIIGIMGRTGNIDIKKKNILAKAGFQEGGLFGSPDFNLVDPKWEYTERSYASCPFPCHPWYDLKAWEWLMENKMKLKPPILFWNIGALPEGWENK